MNEAPFTPDSEQVINLDYDVLLVSGCKYVGRPVRWLMANALNAAYRKGLADAAPKWIPVIKHLPPDGMKVLIYHPQYGIRETVSPRLFFPKKYRDYPATDWQPALPPPQQ